MVLLHGTIVGKVKHNGFITWFYCVSSHCGAFRNRACIWSVPLWDRSYESGGEWRVVTARICLAAIGMYCAQLVRQGHILSVSCSALESVVLWQPQPKCDCSSGHGQVGPTSLRGDRPAICRIWQRCDEK